jgi:hypothetical protein
MMNSAAVATLFSAALQIGNSPHKSNDFSDSLELSEAHGIVLALSWINAHLAREEGGP